MSSSENSNRDDAWLFPLLIAAAVVVAIIPTAVAVLIVWLFRGVMRRIEWLLVGLVGLALLYFTWNMTATTYFSWLRSVPFDGWLNALNVPIFPVLILSLPIASVLGMVQGTAMAGAAAQKLPWAHKESVINKPSVIPVGADLDRLSAQNFDDLAVPTVDRDGDGGRGFVMGVNSDGEKVFITEKEIGMHMLAFGGTGSGKTVSLEVIAGGLLDLGWSGIVLDLKEDTGAGGLREFCEQYCISHSLPYQELALSNPNPSYWFSALAGLQSDEARDTILALSRFDDQYYKSVSIKVLGQLLNLLYWAHEVDPHKFPAPTLHEVARLMSAPNLNNLTKEMRACVIASRPDVTDEDFHTLWRPNQVEDGQAKSWGAKLGNLYETQAGRTVLRPSDGRNLVDVTQNGLTYIGLDSTAKLDLSKVISASVLQRISVDAAQRTTGQLQGPKKPKFVIVDEASVVDRGIVHALLSKARSAGVAVILATQGPKDWMDQDGDDFAKLAQNTNVSLIMNQGEPSSAELCAEYIGREAQVQANLRYQDGELVDAGSVREMRDYIVTPDELRQLQIGTAVMRIGKPETKVSFVKVIPRSAQGTPVAAPQPKAPPSPRRKGIARPPVS